MAGMNQSADLKSVHALDTWKLSKIGENLRKAGPVVVKFANTKVTDEILARAGLV